MIKHRLTRSLRKVLERHPIYYRIRYVLITKIGHSEFSKKPTQPNLDEVPPEFTRRTTDLDLSKERDFHDAIAIAFDLSKGHRRGAGLGYSSVDSLDLIYQGEGGVCSDYTQVFLGLCISASIPAREWGVCASFNNPGLGHSFSEIYSKAHNKWIFIDPIFSIFATLRGKSVPLSATELIELTGQDRASEVVIQIIEPDGPDSQLRSVYLERYLNKSHFFFLFVNNDLFKQDYFLKSAKYVPLPALHFTMLICGAYPRFQVYEYSGNSAHIAQEVRLLRAWFCRLSLVAVALAFSILTVVFHSWPF